MNILEMGGTCSVCGCSGLHACPGYMMKPWTPEEEAHLENVLRTIFGEEKAAREAEEAQINE